MTHETPYTPPKIWSWAKENGGQFANINRPVSGATHDKDLPVGKHPFQLYSLATPNGVKVTVMLEELLAAGHAGAEYDAWPIRINEGDQFGSGFVAINPNSKIPALVDRSGPTPIAIFESGAILMHLAEKFGAFLPTEAAARAECLSWLFWQMGSAPYLGGGFGHFYAYAPEKFEYPIDRFAMEVKRQLDVLDKRLADHEYLGGADYTIADIATWPWYGGLVQGLLYNAGEFLQVQEYKNMKRWSDAIAARPAAKRGKMVNRTFGEPSSQLQERHDASDFDTRTQDKLEAKRACEATALVIPDGAKRRSGTGELYAVQIGAHRFRVRLRRPGMTAPPHSPRTLSRQRSVAAPASGRSLALLLSKPPAFHRGSSVIAFMLPCAPQPSPPPGYQ